MDRVLSIRTHRGCNGQSEYVRKSFCISIVFVIGFIGIFVGYLLGRISMQHEYIMKHQDNNYVPQYIVRNSPEITFELNMLAVTIDTILNYTLYIKDDEVRNNSIVNIVDVINCLDETSINSTMITNLQESVKNSEIKLPTVIKRFIQENVHQVNECYMDTRLKLEQANL